ncbi:MAG TPA: hypothetical protein VK635_20620 [Bradyrhizobium sp.]|nr:hypothetical protein [Bradyrhizobium sp.]
MVVCDRHILVFSDKSIAFPDGDPTLAWKRWKKRSVLNSVRQLHGANRFLRLPNPHIYADRAQKTPLRCELPPIAERDIHLIAVANGATEACSQLMGEPIGTLMLSNDTGETAPFVIGDVGHTDVFVHVFTDLSLRLVLHEFDTITDLVKYLHNRAAFFRGQMGVMARGEEELIPLYFRGYSDLSKDYDIARAVSKIEEKPDQLWIEGGFYEDMLKRPEYIARRERNRVSYLWDGLIERFAGHQIQGTSIQQRPSGFDRHEGGIRFMALEPRVARRSHSEQLLHAIGRFPEDRDLTARTIMPNQASSEMLAYLFLQFRSPTYISSYDEYRRVRSHLLQIYAMALLHDHASLARVVGIATEPPRLFKDKRVSEDMVLVERSMLTLAALAEAKKEKMELGLSTTITSGTWSGQEFPDTTE